MDTHIGLVAVVVSINMLACAGVIVFFFFRRLETLEGYLGGVKCVEWNKSLFGDGYFGRQQRLSTVMMIVLMPNILYKRGEIPKDADKRIPAKLRYQVKAAAVYVILTVVAMCMFYFVMPDE